MGGAPLGGRHRASAINRRRARVASSSELLLASVLPTARLHFLSTMPMPSFDSDDKEVMDFFQGLSIGERRPLWRTAKFYNQMTELTTA